MSYQHVCAQCERPFVARRPDAETCSEECKYQRWIEKQVASAQPVGEHSLQEVRDQRAVTKHNRDLGGLIRQAIVDQLKTVGTCAPEDLIGVYPQGEVDLCRRLATAQFGSLAASRDGKEPLIQEKERRKSTIPARKGAKVSVWELTPAGRRHYGIGHTLVGSSAEGNGAAATSPSSHLGTASGEKTNARVSVANGEGTAAHTRDSGTLDRPVSPAGGGTSTGAPQTVVDADPGDEPDKSGSGDVAPPAPPASPGPASLPGLEPTPSAYDPYSEAA